MRGLFFFPDPQFERPQISQAKSKYHHFNTGDKLRPKNRTWLLIFFLQSIKHLRYYDCMRLVLAAIQMHREENILRITNNEYVPSSMFLEI